jgi:hypothetical protein
MVDTAKTGAPGHSGTDRDIDEGGPTGIVEVTACSDGTFLVADRETGTYGHGNSPDEAFGDFIVALGEYRDVLAQDARLSERLAGHLAFITALLPSTAHPV